MSAMTVSAAASHHVRPARAVRPVRPVRLTRRGRVVVAALLLLLALAALALLRAPATASTLVRGASTAPVAERVTVRPGETLWQIAQRAVPGADPRDTVARIEDMNGLRSSSVQAGRVLFVPAGR